MLINKIVLTSFLLMFPLMSQATDLGTIGQTYPIIETDFLEFIQTRLKMMESNGELQQIQNKFKENVTRHALRPNPVTGITRTKEQKSWIIDPSITVPYDLRDLSGRVIAKKGTNVNPLFYMTIHHPMVFIDGDDADQVNWAKQWIASNRQGMKLVLVNGSIADISRLFKQPIYFDQEGRLTNKFQIHHVPAVVVQKGTMLSVEEVRV